MKLEDFIHFEKPQGKFLPYWKAKLGSLVAESKQSKEEATRYLFLDIKNSLEGTYTPVIIHHCGYTCLIWREPSGWMYHVRYGTSGPVDRSICMVGNTREECEQYARKHLAQYARSVDASIEVSAECILNASDKADFIRQEYKSLEAQRLMQETGLTWDQANMKLDGLLV